MGNLCGKVSDHDPFDGPGRTLGAADGAADSPGRPVPATRPNPKTAPVPAHKVGGPPRTLGGSVGGAAGGSSAADAARAAAEARNARNARKAGGKLAAQLDAQKRETRSETLKKASEDEVRRRELEAQAAAAQYN